MPRISLTLDPGYLLARKKMIDFILGRVLTNPVQCLLRSEIDRNAARQRNDAKGQEEPFVAT